MSPPAPAAPARLVTPLSAPSIVIRSLAVILMKPKPASLPGSSLKLLLSIWPPPRTTSSLASTLIVPAAPQFVPQIPLVEADVVLLPWPGQRVTDPRQVLAQVLIPRNRKQTHSIVHAAGERLEGWIEGGPPLGEKWV